MQEKFKNLRKNSLRVLRAHRGLTLKQLSDLTGLGLSTIGNFETGRTALSYGSIKKIALALGVEPAEITPIDEWFSSSRDPSEDESDTAAIAAIIAEGVRGAARRTKTQRELIARIRAHSRALVPDDDYAPAHAEIVCLFAAELWSRSASKKITVVEELNPKEDAHK